MKKHPSGQITTLEAAAQRWAIAWHDAALARRQLDRTRQAMAEEHEAALHYVRERGGAVILNLLDGSQILCVENYKGGLTAAIARRVVPISGAICGDSDENVE